MQTRWLLLTLTLSILLAGFPLGAEVITYSGCQKCSVNDVDTPPDGSVVGSSPGISTAESFVLGDTLRAELRDLDPVIAMLLGGDLVDGPVHGLGDYFEIVDGRLVKGRFAFSGRVEVGEGRAAVTLTFEGHPSVRTLTADLAHHEVGRLPLEGPDGRVTEHPLAPAAP